MTTNVEEKFPTILKVYGEMYVVLICPSCILPCHMCQLHTTYGPEVNAEVKIIWAKCFNFRSDPEEKFLSILMV